MFVCSILNKHLPLINYSRSYFLKYLVPITLVIVIWLFELSPIFCLDMLEYRATNCKYSLVPILRTGFINITAPHFFHSNFFP